MASFCHPFPSYLPSNFPFNFFFFLAGATNQPLRHKKTRTCWLLPLTAHLAPPSSQRQRHSFPSHCLLTKRRAKADKGAGKRCHLKPLNQCVIQHKHSSLFFVCCSLASPLSCVLLFSRFSPAKDGHDPVSKPLAHAERAGT